MKIIKLIVVLLIVISGNVRAQDWSEMIKITASDADAGDRYGASIAIDGDFAVVGAPFETGGGFSGGAIYVYEFSGGTWTEIDKLVGSDVGSGDQFGSSVAIDGNRIVAGAPFDNSLGLATGTAYVFEYDGTWDQVDKLTASDWAVNDEFGHAVDIDGDRIIIGVPEAESDHDNEGQAYIYDYFGADWNETAILSASDHFTDDNFGVSVAVSGDRVLVGAYLTDDDGMDSGSAYVFELDGTWSETAKLTASDAAVQDYYGFDVDLENDRALIGAHLDDEGGVNGGSAYVYDYSGAVWSETDKLSPSDPASSNFFARYVALSGDKAILSCTNDDHDVANAGSAYVFEIDGGFWVEYEKLTASDAGPFDQYSSDVAISNKYAGVGAHQNDDDGSNSGSAYIYDACSSPPSVTATASDVELCIGESLTLNGSGADSYSWDMGVVDGVAFEPGLGTTTYTVIGTDERGCQNTDDIDIDVFDLPTVTASASDEELCAGEELTLTGGGAFVYDWEGDVVNGVSFVPDEGTETYTVIGTDVNGCENTAEIDVVVYALPVVTANATGENICIGESLTLTGGGAEDYLWDPVDVIDGVSFEPSIGSVTYTVVGTDDNGCTNTASVMVTVNDLPVIGASSSETEVCFGDEIVLTGDGGDEYEWDMGAVNGVSFVPEEGLNTFTVIGTDDNGCSNSASVDVLVNEAPEVIASATDTELCLGESVTLTSGGDAVSYSWNMGVVDGVAFEQATGVVTYTLTGTDEIGCTAKDSVIITVYDPAAITINLLDDEIEIEETLSGTLDLYANDDFPVEGVYSELYSPTNVFYGVVDGVIDYTGVTVGLDSLNYSICHSACVTECDDAVVLINVIDFVPFDPGNIGFSNNGEDFFLVFPKLEDYPDNDLIVFNRWGDEVFNTVSYQNDWNGTNKNGTKLSRGTYFYTLRVNMNGEDKYFNGYVEIIK